MPATGVSISYKLFKNQNLWRIFGYNVESISSVGLDFYIPCFKPVKSGSHLSILSFC